jgi:hypothetical protein
MYVVKKYIFRFLGVEMALIYCLMISLLFILKMADNNTEINPLPGNPRFLLEDNFQINKMMKELHEAQEREKKGGFFYYNGNP